MENRYCNLHLYVYVIPVCSVDVPAVSSVVSVLTYCVCDRGACMQSYRILCSYGCCSVINVFLWWWGCIIIASQLFICDPLEHGLKSCNVSFAGPYSCLLCNMCMAYAG